MESRKQSREFRSISGSARVRPGPCRRKPLQRRREGPCGVGGTRLREHVRALSSRCRTLGALLGRVRGSPQQGGLQNALGPRDPLTSLRPAWPQQTPLSMGWMGPRGADPGLAASSGPPRAAMFSADVKPAPPLAEPWAWGRGGLGDWPPTLVPHHLSGRHHGMVSAAGGQRLSYRLVPCVPRCPSSGWPWSRSYTESTPTRVTSGATVSGAGSRGAGGVVLG